MILSQALLFIIYMFFLSMDFPLLYWLTLFALWWTREQSWMSAGSAVQWLNLIKQSFVCGIWLSFSVNVSPKTERNSDFLYLFASKHSENGSSPFWGLRRRSADLWGRQPFLPQLPLKEHLHSLPELLAHERVEKRIDAAVQQSQSVGHLQRQIHRPPHGAVKLDQVGSHQRVHHHGDVVR